MENIGMVASGDGGSGGTGEKEGIKKHKLIGTE